MLSFIETPLFTRLLHDYLTDEEYAGSSWRKTRSREMWFRAQAE